MNPERLNQYLDFVEERHRAWEARQVGAAQPWTSDPIVAERKFTNVFRVLDPGSQFVFELEHEDPIDTLFRLFLYRYTNEPATWRWLRTRFGAYPELDFDPGRLINAIIEYRTGGNRVFSGAYVILPQPNREGDKVVQAVELAYRWTEIYAESFLAATTQEQRFYVLRQEYGVGPFMAMQILTDWGYTAHAGDREHEFVHPGPGAIKGAKAISARQAPLQTIHDMHALVTLGDDVPTLPNGRTPSLMDIQNTLCEFSKYVRYADRPRTGRPYKPAHPGAQPAPVLPAHWKA